MEPNILVMVEMLIFLYVIVIQPFETCREVQKKGVGWTCNTVDNTQIGVFLAGQNIVTLRGTMFNNHNTGLLYEPSSTNIPQTLNGNRWLGSTSFDAVYNGTAVNQFSSRLEIDGSPNPNTSPFVPDNFSSYGSWINPNFSGTNFSCNSPQVCNTLFPLVANPNPNPSINAIDISLANNTFSTPAYTAAATYQGKRNLYRKLAENPSLTQVDPSLPPFIPNHQGGCIGHFDNIQKGIEQAFAISSVDSITIDTFQKQCKYYLDSLHCLDSMLYANYDTIVRNLRTALATDFGNIMQQHQAFLTVLNTNQQTALAPVQTANNAFTTYVLHEDFEKQVNDIYLSTFALGIAELTAAQISTLQIIAAYCPQEGGAAVHQARGMLSLFQDVNMLDFDCNSSHAKKAQTNTNDFVESEWEVILYPNPTSSEINVQSNIPLTSNIEIYNALGQLISVKLIENEASIITIDASSLMSGIYIMRLKNGDNTVTKSFVVSK